MNYKEILDSTRQAATVSRPQLAFSTERERAVELDLCLRTGDHWAFPYSYKTAIKFDLSGTIVVYFTTHVISIRGQNLKPLYEGLITHTVSCVREVADEFADVPAESTVVASLRIDEV